MLRSATATRADGDYTYSCDALGRVITLTHSIVGLTPMVTFNQAYDAAGRRTELKTQVNGTAEFVNQYEYDPLGRTVRITQGPQPGGRAVAEKRVDFSYDAAGQLTALARYADLAGTQLVAQSDYTYDQAGRLRNPSHYQGQTTFVQYAWSFDAAGRMTRYVNSIDGTADYTSDATGQLTAADYDYQSDELYEYDANGNRVTANGSTYTTGTNNRLLSDGTYRYLYDAEGNRTYRFIDNNANGQLDQGDTDITKYNWDHRNRLYKVQHQASYAAAVDWVVRYFYDSENRLVRRLEDSNGDGDYEGKRVFLYDGNQIVLDLERTGAGNVQAGDLRWRYLWGPVVDQILAEENVDNGADETVHWTLMDHLNTVRDIARFDPQTGTTTVVNHLVYDAFGKVTSESNPTIDSLFLFTGRPFDSDTQLQNNLNRWYDAHVGRWLSEDPIGFNGGDGNLYRYGGNAAICTHDSLGLKVYEFYGFDTPQSLAEAMLLELLVPLKSPIGWLLGEGGQPTFHFYSQAFDYEPLIQQQVSMTFKSALSKEVYPTLRRHVEPRGWQRSHFDVFDIVAAEIFQSGGSVLAWMLNGTSRLAVYWSIDVTWCYDRAEHRYRGSAEGIGVFTWHDTLDWQSWYERFRTGAETWRGVTWNVIEGFLDLVGDKLLDMEYDVIITYVAKRGPESFEITA